MEALIIVFIVALVIKVIVKVRAEEKYAAKHKLFSNDYKYNVLDNNENIFSEQQSFSHPFSLSDQIPAPISLDISVCNDEI